MAAAVFYGTAPSSRAEDDRDGATPEPIGQTVEAVAPQIANLPHIESSSQVSRPDPIVELVALPPDAEITAPTTFVPDPKALAWVKEWERAAEATVDLGLLASPGIRAASRTEVERTLVVRRGDTMMHLLKRATIPGDQALLAIRAMRQVYDPRRIVPGQKLTVSFAASDAALADRGFQLRHVSLTTGLDEAVMVERSAADGFKGRMVKMPTETRLARSSGTIKTSLYLAAKASRLPQAVFLQFVRVYSWDVDFQRDLRPGDRFDVAWEAFYTPDGHFVRHGKMLYASLTLSGEEHKLYRFTGYYGTGYFDEKGAGARKPLMRTPIDGARLSSKYGRRRHPFLGYTLMHRGVDFAARPGTPVLAAGDGRVAYAGRNGAYGNFVKIRHNSRYQTAYAHLKGIKRGLKPGSRVRQGQVIGYLGSTGRSTGPHLHYEILVDDQQVNPMRVKMPSHQKLRGKELARFQAHLGSLTQRIAQIGGGGPILAKASSR